MEIEIKFNEVFNAPMGRLVHALYTGRYAHTYMPTNIQNIKNIYKIKYQS